MRHTTERSRKGSLVVGVLFAFAVVVGGEVYRTNSITGLAQSPGYALAQVVLAIVVAIAAAGASLALCFAQRSIAARNPKKTWEALGTGKAFAAIWAIMFCAWLPCLLAYWPGSFAYDITTQTDFVVTGHWTTQQPPLHTLIWAFFLQLEGFCGLRAVTWCALAQMAFLSGCFSAVLRFIAQQGTSRIIWVLAFAFFVPNPVMALFAITPVKDAMLAGMLALFSLGVARLASSPTTFLASKARCAGFMACLLVCALLRSNMFIAVVLFAIVAVVGVRECRAKVAMLVWVPVACALVIIGPVYSLAGITPGSSAVASVPFQQVANVVRHHADELSEDERAVVSAVLPIKKATKAYNPRFADPVVHLFKGKKAGVSGYRSQLLAFAALWVSFIGRYPADCIDAFLSLNVPYWYPFAETPDPYSQRIYIETSVWKGTPYYDVQLESKAPTLHAAYEGIADFSALDNPLARAVFSPSSVIWVLVLVSYLLYNSGSRRNTLLAALPVLFWLTFMIGPVSNMRYVFPLFAFYPLGIAAALQPGRIFGKTQGR